MGVFEWLSWLAYIVPVANKGYYGHCGVILSCLLFVSLHHVLLVLVLFHFLPCLCGL